MSDQQAATPDTTDNLISVSYHALQSVDTLHTCLRDAEETADTALAKLLTEAIQQQCDLAAQAKESLAQRLGASSS